ncbi:MAG: 4-hydroxythreonine-4-phosphate dehydrogenase PdxA [Saprospiraceae bacterium]|nr:MAG: 4-hydroxythreonine-4-phosphate dehydrogenase [Bacteroidetes bacterium OLB9]MCO6464710.1 4-hydroxythreonine-4-phosphate dehydrogenase PdxA [Saprospiraceae bacterium]MCZ2337277.1 4-hydroxythreonine-4-phosphate dehydrogenase PdxA [Chitinophagales bacterium]
MIKIGITIGDINGIGPEVIIKALSNPMILNSFTPIIYASYKVLSYHKNIVKESSIGFHTIPNAASAVDNKINLISCWNDNVNITLGKATADGGKYAKISMEKALDDIKSGSIDAIVTAPINKNAMQQANFPFPGHTEFFTKGDQKEESLMLLASDALRVAVVTNHIPLSQVASSINKDLILNKIQILNKTLIEDFGIERPVIGVLGLNPHASDDSTIGNEEENFIRPAIIEAKKSGIMAAGPYSPDGFFASGLWKKVDAVLAMYHDQGLIPFKALTFGGGVNFTAGLSFIRTSPDHGTAYEIAGTNKADGASFRQALYMAYDLVRNRKDYFESRENALVRREKKSEGLNA